MVDRDAGASAQFFGFVGEILGGTEEVRANGAAPFFMSRLIQILRGWLPDQVRAGGDGRRCGRPTSSSSPSAHR